MAKKKRRGSRSRRGGARPGAGRPPKRGKTVPVAFRMRKEISDRIEALRRRAAASVTKTRALEKLILAGLKEEARIAKELSEDEA